MTLSRHDQASFETTKRLLAELVNEGLVDAKLENSTPTSSHHLCLRSLLGPQDATCVRVGLVADTVVERQDDRVISVVRPDTLQPPVSLGNAMNQELDPGTIFKFLSPGFIDSTGEKVIAEEIIEELRNSARNQEKWLEIAEGQKVLSLRDAGADWEHVLIHGHPTHPYHRLCYAQAPLKPVFPEDIPGMLQPTLAFVAVHRNHLRITGPFEQELQPLLDGLDVPKTTRDCLVVPVLFQQLPSVQQRFPAAVVLKSIPDCATAQASMRTLTVRPELNFKYHLKLSLACQITSALRTITPWTTCGGPVQTEILEKLLPEDLWVFREVAAVSGSQENFSEARHLSCILRDSLESRAQANGEVLVIAAAFAQSPHGESRTYAEILFRLETQLQKKEWFQRYVSCLFGLVMPPLVQYGVGLEGHGQNLVARVCQQTGRIKGFAVRDFGGVRMHVPTLREHGISYDTLPPGGATLVDDMENVWSKVHHSLLQNHVGCLLGALGLETCGGWAIALDTLSTVLEPGQGSPGQSLFEYFTRDTMPFKCFLRMRMEGKHRDYIEREVPNVLLMDSPRWKDILNTYQPSLHAT